jgi:hypothetical protein
MVGKTRLLAAISPSAARVQLHSGRTWLFNVYLLILNPRFLLSPRAMKVTANATDNVDWMTNPASARGVRARLWRDHPVAFLPVAGDPALPRVLLIGDSISIGYTPAVKELLRGIANVHRIPDNGGATTLALTLLDEWLGDGLGL